MYLYYLAYDDGNIIIRVEPHTSIQRFDKKKKRWVIDWNMCGIYSGDIPCRPLTEQEANRMIENG